MQFDFRPHKRISIAMKVLGFSNDQRHLGRADVLRALSTVVHHEILQRLNRLMLMVLEALGVSEMVIVQRSVSTWLQIVMLSCTPNEDRQHMNVLKLPTGGLKRNYPSRGQNPIEQDHFPAEKRSGLGQVYSRKYRVHICRARPPIPRNGFP